MKKWDEIAEPWIQEWGVIEPWQVEERKEFAKLCGNGLMLSLGCNGGRDLQIFTRLGLTCVGLDFSFKMLSKAKDGNIVVQSDVQHVPIKDEVFDAVWSCSVFKYLSINGVIESLQEAYRVLKKGGFFWLSVEYGEGVKVEDKHGVEMETSLFTEETLTNMAKQVGFKVVSFKIIDKWRKFIVILLQK